MCWCWCLVIQSCPVFCDPLAQMIKASKCNVGDLHSIPRSERSPREGNGNPLQYSCLENSMDGGTWWATVHGVAESDVTEWLHFISFFLWTVPCQAPLSMGFFQARMLEWVAIFLLHGLFQNQGSNPHLLCFLHYRQILYTLSHWGSLIQYNPLYMLLDLVF